jgi:hypothetical protein
MAALLISQKTDPRTYPLGALSASCPEKLFVDVRR